MLENGLEDGFLAKLRANPKDDASRLVYADWLEERGRHHESELLRLQVTLQAMTTEDPTFETSGVRLRELALKVDQAWQCR